LGDEGEAVEQQPGHERDRDPARRPGTAAFAVAAEHATQRVEEPVEGAAAAAPTRVAAVLAGPAGDVPGYLISKWACRRGMRESFDSRRGVRPAQPAAAAAARPSRGARGARRRRARGPGPGSSRARRGLRRG